MWRAEQTVAVAAVVVVFAASGLLGCGGASGVHVEPDSSEPRAEVVVRSRYVPPPASGTRQFERVYIDGKRSRARVERISAAVGSSTFFEAMDGYVRTVFVQPGPSKWRIDWGTSILTVEHETHFVSRGTSPNGASMGVAPVVVEVAGSTPVAHCERELDLVLLPAHRYVIDITLDPAGCRVACAQWNEGREVPLNCNPVQPTGAN